MLRQLAIKRVALIDDLTLDFAAGLGVLTGETGAGKSILLDALGFVLGWRGRAELVRSGAEQGEVKFLGSYPVARAETDDRRESPVVRPKNDSDWVDDLITQIRKAD